MEWDWPTGSLVIKAGDREGPGEEEDSIRDGGGMIRNRQRDAPRNEDINRPKVGKPGRKGRGNVGMEFAGYLYAIGMEVGWFRAKLQSK